MALSSTRPVPTRTRAVALLTVLLVAIGLATAPSDLATAAYDKLPAFPGAEGFGYAATGGRSGEVYHVTSYELTGPGTFHDALTTAGDVPRTIVFDISGDVPIPQITVQGKSGITIAGQTAPGDGVTIRGNGIRFIESSDIVIRHLRFRMGMQEINDDAMYFEDSQNVIIDHSSFSWATDEVLSIKSKDYENPRSKNITVQWSIMSEALLTHSMGGLVEMNTISMHHNLYAHNNDRNPKTKGVMDFVNNVVYNWGGFPFVAGGESETKGYGNVVGNYFVAGTNSADPEFAVVRGNDNYQVYLDDNRVDSDKDGVLDGTDTGSGMIETDRPALQVPERFEYPPVHTQSPEEAYDLTLDYAGASVSRDDVDERVAQEVRDQTGTIIGNESDVGGYPELRQAKAPKDTDRDGMADKWERAHTLDPRDAEDRNSDRDGDGYTNLEEYLNALAAPGWPAQYPLSPMAWSGEPFDPPVQPAEPATPSPVLDGEVIRSAIVTDDSSNGTANAALWSIEQNLRPGDIVAGDRVTGNKIYRFVDVPGALQGQEWIRPAVESRSATGDSLLTFTLAADADVYVAHDARIAPRPEWLASRYAATGLTVRDDQNVTWDLFKAPFGAGERVQMGANGSTSGMNYFVVVAPSAPDTTAPEGAVTGLTIGEDTSNGVSLAWDDADTATSYLIWRTSGHESEARIVATAAESVYIDTGAELGVGYSYAVSAINAGGAGSPSAPASVLPIDSSRPRADVPSAPIAERVGSYSVDLKWAPVSGATGYGVYRTTASQEGFIHLGYVTGTTFTDADADPATAYEYVVTSTATGGESETSARTSVTTGEPLQPVAAPTDLASEAVETGSFGLSWTPTEGAEEYTVYRREGERGEFGAIATVTEPRFVDVGSPSVAAYDYAVSASNELGESALSASIRVDTPVPAAPTDLVVGRQGSTSTGLIWTSPGHLTEYRVLRSEAGEAPVEIGTAKVETFYDRAAEPDTEYTYVVVAVNAAGWSEPSSPVAAHTLPISGQ